MLVNKVKIKNSDIAMGNAKLSLNFDSIINQAVNPKAYIINPIINSFFKNKLYNVDVLTILCSNESFINTNPPPLKTVYNKNNKTLITIFIVDIPLYIYVNERIF